MSRPAVPLFHTLLGPPDGPPVVLVHGWGGDGREWSELAEALGRRHRVIVPDLRGHGRSPVPDDGNTPAAMADDLAALLAGLGRDPVVAVGHSMGAQVVNLLAVAAPGAVRAVVALDPAHGAAESDAPGIRARVAELAERGASAAADFVEGAFSPGAPPGLRTAQSRTVRGTPAHVLAQSCAGTYLTPEAVGFRPATEALLRRRTRPAVTVWTQPALAAWERGVTGEPVEVWPGTGHYVHLERPAATLRLIETAV